jgi:hypothetical protein
MEVILFDETGYQWSPNPRWMNDTTMNVLEWWLTDCLEVDCVLTSSEPFQHCTDFSTPVLTLHEKQVH